MTIDGHNYYYQTLIQFYVYGFREEPGPSINYEFVLKISS